MSDAAPERARSLLQLINVASEGGDSFLAPMSHNYGPRLFGGLVAAQSMAAACRTVVPEHRPQSMHAYFILAGNPDIPLRLDVERTRDGRSFTTRRVVASQAGAAIFEMSASFHKEEEGEDWSAPIPIDTPDPDDLPVFVGPESRPSGTFFEMRPVKKPMGPFAPPPYWVRVNEDVPDDPAIQACVLAYLSDMGILAMARPPRSSYMGPAASLDHAIWFHRRFDPSQWHLFSGAPRSNYGARGLAVGGLHARSGELVASVVQEGLFRQPR